MNSKDFKTCICGAKMIPFGFMSYPVFECVKCGKKEYPSNKTEKPKHDRDIKPLLEKK